VTAARHHQREGTTDIRTTYIAGTYSERQAQGTSPIRYIFQRVRTILTSPLPHAAILHPSQPHQPLSSSSSFSVIICLSLQHSCHTATIHIHQPLLAYKSSSMSVAIASSFSNHMREPWRAAASQRVLPQSVLLLDQTEPCTSLYIRYLFMA
jgi:hypothetical protein